MKMWPLQATLGFSKIPPGDVVFDPTFPIFTFVKGFIKAHSLTKFHAYRTENVASIAYTRFY